MDGVCVGQTPTKAILLSKATHRITLRKMGYEEFTTYIAPRPRGLLFHLLTLGMMINTPEQDALDCTYQFELHPSKIGQE